MSNEPSDNSQPPLASQSKQRLADISHHFLSDADERTPVWQNSHFIPVLLGSRSDDYIVYELERAFNQQHHTSMVLNIEGLGSSQALSTRVSDKFSAQSIECTAEDRILPEYCLIPVTSPSTTLALQCERLVIAVHASLSGVRIAYNQLSFLASLQTNFNVCIVMFGARSGGEAMRFFHFLCRNARSLLELKLECGGYVLQPGAQWNETQQDSRAGMKNVAHFIAESYTKPKRRSQAPQLSAPHNPAALLLS